MYSVFVLFLLSTLRNSIKCKHINIHDTHPHDYVYIMKTCLFKYIENFTSKNWKFSDKILWYFSYFCPNIDCGWGSSNKYPQSMFLSKNKKNNVYPCKPHFYYTEVGIKGSKLYRHIFVMRDLIDFHEGLSGVGRCFIFYSHFMQSIQ